MASITFSIGDLATGVPLPMPVVTVTVTENIDGSLTFVVAMDPGGTLGDFSALWFDVSDETLINTLSLTALTSPTGDAAPEGSDEDAQLFDPPVMVLTQGNDTITVLDGQDNLNGLDGALYGTDGGYDLGIRIDQNPDKIDNYQSVSFTLASSSRALTLADFTDVDAAVRIASAGADEEPFDGDGDGEGSWKIAGHLDPPPPPGAAELSVVKDTVCHDGESIDGGVVLAGAEIGWTYTVKNTGTTGTAVSGLSLSDDVLGIIYGSGLVDPDSLGLDVDLVGDENDDGLIQDTETWVFTVHGTASTGDYANTATVSGKDADSDEDLESVNSETNTYFGAAPEISVDKDTQGYVDNGGTAELEAAAGDGHSILAGYDVFWTYAVTNDGNVDLTNVVVTDGLEGVAVLDLTSDDGDGLLNAGETWVFKLSGTAILGEYTNTVEVTADTYYGGEVRAEDDCGNSLSVSAEGGSSYTGTFTRGQGALTQGFWANHIEAWNPDTAKDGKNWSNLVASDVLSSLDINPNASGCIVLNAGGLDTLKIEFGAAKALLASSTSGDARAIMLAQAVAAQLNIYNGGDAPNGLMADVVNWLKTFGGSVLGDGVLSAGEVSTTKNGATLGGASLKTSSDAWQKYMDVVSGTPSWDFDFDGNSSNGNQEANGEGIKNALMYWNDGHLVTSDGGLQVGWDADGNGGSNTLAHINPNDMDHFWRTLHDVTPDLIGIA
jgi:hypothetical protein